MFWKSYDLGSDKTNIKVVTGMSICKRYFRKDITTELIDEKKTINTKKLMEKTKWVSHLFGYLSS